MTTIKLKNCLWSPYHNEHGYASGRMHTINFDSKQECDEVCKQYNLELEERKKMAPSYDGGFYVSLPFIRGIDLLNAIVETE
jgi:hypothetical protein